MRLGDFFKFWLGPEVKVVVQDPNDIEVEEEVYCVLLFRNKLANTNLVFRMLFRACEKISDSFK